VDGYINFRLMMKFGVGRELSAMEETRNVETI